MVAVVISAMNMAQVKRKHYHSITLFLIWTADVGVCQKSEYFSTTYKTFARTA
jgi:hypothetical protein